MLHNLKDVTICAIDSVHPHLAARALTLSSKFCTFQSSLLLTDQDIQGPAFRTIPIQRLNSSEDYSRFILAELTTHIHTPFVLIVQWDGYVVDANQWQESFLQYDYIGAVWPWDWVPDHKRVGNGGFSLRSKRLLDITSYDPQFIYVEGQPEDLLIGNVNHEYLTESCNIQFAPVDLANQFAYECLVPNTPTLGFHGLFNIWRHNNDEQMLDIIDQLSAYLLKSQSYIELIIHYYNLRNFKLLTALYKKMKTSLNDEDIISSFKHYAQYKIDMNHCIHLCEQLLTRPY